MTALDDQGMIDQFNRLQGRKLGTKPALTSIEKMIDQATGYDGEISAQESSDMKAFIKFVQDCIWSRIPEKDLIDIANRVLTSKEKE